MSKLSPPSQAATNAQSDQDINELLTKEKLARVFTNDYSNLCTASNISNIHIATATRDIKLLKDSLQQMKQVKAEKENQDQNVECSALNGTQTNQLSETIKLAIREPFDCEVKNRLLGSSGSLRQLTDNPKFEIFLTAKPKVVARSIVSFKTNSYNVLKAIGEGGFAKIYTIKSKDQKTAAVRALKVG
jgi:hypothetical protein